MNRPLPFIKVLRVPTDPTPQRKRNDKNEGFVDLRKAMEDEDDDDDDEFHDEFKFAKKSICALSRTRPSCHILPEE